jgi:hypothetical protein
VENAGVGARSAALSNLTVVIGLQDLPGLAELAVQLEERASR